MIQEIQEIREYETGRVLARMLGVTLREADLSFWDLGGAELTARDLAHSSCDGASLREVMASAADFTGASLVGAGLYSAALMGSSFRGADLSFASLTNAWLQGADLRGALLISASCRGTCFQGADLRGADMSGANVDAADFLGACVDERTRLPDDYPDPAPEGWPNSGAPAFPDLSDLLPEYEPEG